MKEGEEYKCIETVVLDDPDGTVAYIKGKTYLCEQDGCLTDEQGKKEHGWTDSDREPILWDVDLWKRHFILEYSPTLHLEKFK